MGEMCAPMRRNVDDDRAVDALVSPDLLFFVM